MRLLIPLLLFVTFHCIVGKSNVRPVIEAGQDVIEIGGPLKELPSDLEEEPSAESDDDDDTTKTSTTLTAATKKEVKKTTTILTTLGDSRRKNKEVETTVTTEDDEEARIEKELAEIYKDNTDYKDSAEVKQPEVKSVNAIEQDMKPIARSKTNFQFQPDLNNKAEVERFRTSIDEIACDKRQKLAAAATETSPTGKPNTASTTAVNMIHFVTLVSLTYCL